MPALAEKQAQALNDLATILHAVPAASRVSLSDPVARLLGLADLRLDDHKFLLNARPLAFLPGRPPRISKRFEARTYYFELIKDVGDQAYAEGYASLSELVRLLDRSDRMVDIYLRNPRYESRQHGGLATVPHGNRWAADYGHICFMRVGREPDDVAEQLTLAQALAKQPKPRGYQVPTRR